MTQQREYVVKHDGTLIRRDISEVEVSVTQAALQALATGVVMKVRKAIPIPGFGVASIATADPDSKVSYWTVPLGGLTLKTRYELKDGIMYPRFRSASVDHPIIEMKWTNNIAFTLVGMALKFVARVETAVANSTVSKVYLFAYSSDGNAWRLPLANLFETCEICNGTYNSRSASAAEAVQAALEQFDKAQWNQDLVERTTDQSAFDKFWRFKPLEKGFEQLHVNAINWTNLCTKVSTDTMNYVV